MFYFIENVTLHVVETDGYYHWCMDSLDVGLYPQPDVRGQNVCVSGNNIANGTLLTRPNDRLLGKSGPVLHSILQQRDEMKQIFTHAFLHFMDNRNGVDRTGENYDRLW